MKHLGRPIRLTRCLAGVRVWGAPESTDAVVVRGGRIAAMGSWRELRAALGGSFRVQDCGGALLLPGFHDAHVHLAAGALWLAGVDLRACGGAREAARVLAEKARSLPRGAWIRGFGWREEWVASDASRLEGAAPEHPVVLAREDGHAVWINRAAACRFGLGRSALVAREAEAARLRERLPPPEEAEWREALGRGLESLRQAGVTSIQDVLTEPAEALRALEAYATLRRRGALTCRVDLWLPLEMDARGAEALRRRFPPDDPWLSVGTRKVFLDGTLGARSAALEEPYADAAPSRGRLRSTPERLRTALARAAAQGWAIAFHAIGDRAVRAALDAIGALPRPLGSRRHRIEHAQLVREEDFHRARRLGVAVCVQPLHLWQDAPWAARRLGRSRAARAYPWRSFLRAGVPLLLGSDWPVGRFEPLAILAAACRRPAGPWDRAEALAVEEAVEACTRTPGELSGRRRRVGRLAPGWCADFVLVQGDLEALVDGSRKPRVVQTWVGGKLCWSADLAGDPIPATGEGRSPPIV